MTHKRVTAGEQKQRHEWAIRQIDAGMGLSELTALTAQEPGGGLAKTPVMFWRKLMQIALRRSITKTSIGEICFLQQVARLERIARKAENCGQFSAAVGAITALNRMMALGADQKGLPGHRTYRYRR